MLKKIFNKFKNEKFKNFLEGKLVYIENVPDEVFSEKMMGDGYAINPVDSNIYAPMSGKVTSLFPTGHALGLELNNGKQIMIHLGLDTVELKGEGFQIFVKEGQNVNQGDVMIKVNWEFIKRKGYNPVSIIAFPNGEAIRLNKKENDLISALEENVFDFV